jgi:hypothetical protein
MPAVALSVPSRRDGAREGWLAAAAIGVLFVVMLAATWQRWTHPAIDHGREINLPSRLLAGERLYTDISYHYGPFAPYFNALLYRLFGVRLGTLHTSGAVCALFILFLIYQLARHLMTATEATMTTGLVLVTCALNGSFGNYIQPYAYAALYGWTWTLASLWCVLRFLKSRQPRWMCWTGLASAAAMVCKPEYCLLCAIPAAVGWGLASLEQRRCLWRAASLLVLPGVVIGGLTYGLLIVRVSWERMIGENYTMLSQPGMTYFARAIDGTLDWPSSGWALLAAVGMSMLACGATALIGLALAPRVDSLWRGRAWLVWGLIAAGWWSWSLQARAPGFVDFDPLRGAPIVLLVTIGWMAYTQWRAHQRGEDVPLREQVLLVIAVFSLLSIYRVIFNVSLTSFYTPFTVPGVIIVYLYLFFRVSPAILLERDDCRRHARRGALVLIATVVAILAVGHATLARSRAVFTVSAPRGQLVTYPMLGTPVAKAIDLVIARTAATDELVSLPQGTLINFLAERRNPLREEALVPGVLTPDRETAVIRRLAEHRVPLILIGNLLTPEYGARVFGVDYDQALMHWIEAHYDQVATFSASNNDDLHFGDAEFFIRAYARKRSASRQLLRRELQQPAGRRRITTHRGGATVGQDIHRTVGPDPHIPDPRM